MTRASIVVVAASLLFSTQCFAQCGVRIPGGAIALCGSTYGAVTRLSYLPPASGGVSEITVQCTSGPCSSFPNFLVVTPSPISSLSLVGPNPNVIKDMQPGRYGAFLRYRTGDQTPSSLPHFFIVSFDLTGPPTPKIDAVVNAASLTGPIAPGAAVSILGSNLGPPAFSSTYNSAGMYPTEWGNATVTFNGVAARLLYVSPERINAVVPFAVAGQASAQVVVHYFKNEFNTNPMSPAFSVPVAATAPAIFTSAQNGSGQGLFIHYPSNSYNSVDNPTPPGSAITLFATGEGMWDDSVQDGAISIGVHDFITKPVSLTIGGKSARILYAGAAPYQAARLQINAFIPEGIASGPQSVILKIGDADNAQQGVIISIR